MPHCPLCLLHALPWNPYTWPPLATSLITVRFRLFVCE